MARPLESSNGSTLYQVMIGLTRDILNTHDEITGETAANLLKMLTLRKSTMGFTKAALKLDSLTGLDVSDRIESFEAEKAQKRED